MNIYENFNEFYNKFLIENEKNFKEVESYRKNAINERKQIILLSVIFGIVFFILAMSTIICMNDSNKETLEELGPTFFCMIFAFPVVIVLIKRKNLNKYERIYKEKIIKNLTKSFCSYLEYDQDGKIEYEDFKKIDSEYWNCWSSSDFIKGICDNEEIIIAQVITQYNRHSYKNYSRYDIFDGAFAKIKLLDSFNTELFIKNVNRFNKRKNEEEFLKNNYDKININELNHIFDIYSSNIDVAKSILDSKITQILLEIYNDEKYEIAIIGNYVYIKIWEAALFSSPPLEKETYDKESIFKNYKVLYIIFYLITMLKEKT